MPAPTATRLSDLQHAHLIADRLTTHAGGTEEALEALTDFIEGGYAPHLHPAALTATLRSVTPSNVSAVFARLEDQG